jgi:hypothetical protein
MGGAVESVGNVAGKVIGGVGGAVNSAVQQIPGIGPVLGPAAGMLLKQSPLSAFGSSLTTHLFNGVGGAVGAGAVAVDHLRLHMLNLTLATAIIPTNTAMQNLMLILILLQATGVFIIYFQR